ncbi:MAG: four helix bundle protein [Nitrospirae bacterium]|nr:four helix bundle protein [Nitrospirota bacterium]
MGKKGFRDLVVWQKAKDLAVRMYQLAASGGLGRDSGLRDHICRSAVSIASNLAEGDERGTDREAVRFFYIAKGSLAEFRTQIQIAHESGQLKRSVYEGLEGDCETLGKMLGSLIKVRHAQSTKSL